MNPTTRQVLHSLLEFAFSAIMASSDAAASAGHWVRDGPASVALPFRRTGSAWTERANMAPVRVPAILVEDLILLGCYAHCRGDKCVVLSLVEVATGLSVGQGASGCGEGGLRCCSIFPMALTAKPSSYTCVFIGNNLG